MTLPLAAHTRWWRPSLSSSLDGRVSRWVDGSDVAKVERQRVLSVWNFGANGLAGRFQIY
jgi:hypothetical protein